MKVSARLPDPSAEEIAVSHELADRLRAAIGAADGFISFEHFMERALYAPGLGYYVAGAHKFGAAGDFMTAPELTPLFGACLAEQCAATLQVIGGGIVEFGGGSGRLAVSVLEALQRLGQEDVPYAIVELSPELRARQRAHIEAVAPALLPRVEWWQGPPAAPWAGVVIANEVLDALPVARFEITDGQIFECGVGLAANAHFEWRLRLATDPLLTEIRAALPAGPDAYPDGYRSELSRRQAAWIADLRRFLRRGVTLLIDYGYPCAEYYHPARHTGTLQCYYRHRAHADPFWYPGLQDITASVDFSAVAEAAVAAGLEVAGFAEQAQFLLACGITEKLAACHSLDAAEAYRAAQAAKMLLLPQEMGTRIKCMTLTLEAAGPICGYTLRDGRHRL